MKITNKLGLPQAFVNMAMDWEKMADNEYRVTSLLKGVRESILERRFFDNIEQDVADMIWLLFGTAVHSILEKYHDEEGHELKEERLKVDFKDMVLTGKFDLYDSKEKVVIDYKTCSSWKVIFEDYKDWKRQLLIYAWMLREYGFDCNKGRVVAILKDQSKSKAKFDLSYPQYPVKVINFTFKEKDFEDIEDWIVNRLTLIKLSEDLPDDELPICTPDERFNSGDKYAVMQKGKKRASRVFDNQAEADEYIENNGGYLEIRKGEDKKCSTYCRVSEFCSYWKENGGKVNG